MATPEESYQGLDLEELLDRYPCGYCGAAPAERCHRKNGKRLTPYPHASRWNQAHDSGMVARWRRDNGHDPR